MKKVLLVVLVIGLSMLLIACGEENKPTSGDTDTKVKTEVEKEPFYGVEEYSNADFTDRTDFRVEKSESANDIEYDRIFLHGMNNAQLDLKFKDGKIGTLMVSKFVGDVPEEVNTYSIANTEVTKYTTADGIYHYTWSKDNFFYDFQTIEDFSDEDLTKVINGYSIVIGE